MDDDEFAVLSDGTRKTTNRSSRRVEPGFADLYPTPLRTLSYGGGVQSTALLVLAAGGDIDIDVAIHANVGDDSEDPLTIAYLRDHVIPWADGRVDLRVRSHHKRTLREQLLRGEIKGVHLPIRRSDGGPPGPRSCTADWKVGVVRKEAQSMGGEERGHLVHLGISTDEAHRAARKTTDVKWERLCYPLLDLGLSRNDCINVVVDEGLPEPPPSSCFFCPLHTTQAWSEMRRDRPEVFAAAADMERRINERLASHDRDPVYLSRFGRPLADALGPGVQLPMMLDDADGGCDSGYCGT